MIANFKYRKKHGHLLGGQAQLSDMLGLMLNENDRLVSFKLIIHTY
jgi:hypothetical protein